MGRTAGPENTSPGARREDGAPEWMLGLVRGPLSRTLDWLVVGIKPRGKDLGDFWVSGSCAWVDVLLSATLSLNTTTKIMG